MAALPPVIQALLEREWPFLCLQFLNRFMPGKVPLDPYGEPLPDFVGAHIRLFREAAGVDRKNADVLADARGQMDED
jgi:hypothetical protein